MEQAVLAEASSHGAGSASRVTHKEHEVSGFSSGGMILNDLVQTCVNLMSYSDPLELYSRLMLMTLSG